MTELRVTDRYIRSVRQITSARLQKRLEELVVLIEQVPTVGSTLNRPWLKSEFGSRCLTLDLKPFLLVYEYDEENDVAALYGIVHHGQVK
ncbi:type II toxin-antitoxin system RelE/ParE family toxin [uncultured Adlercreutzia sp.]|uniref:type II toxin-antitoxin system RelE/ParE family toxin n=1 Tax=uncultured Adlercreutzia sp. TaxID=875803 RepID=UPI0034A5721B